MRVGFRHIVRAMVFVAFLPSGGCNNNLYRSPHQQGFKDQHSLQLKASSYDNTTCQACHGADLKGGKGRSCYSCHPLYPHTADMKSIHPDIIELLIATVAEINADPALAKTKLGPYACQPCHDNSTTENEGGKPGCGYCHAGADHGLVDHSTVEAAIKTHPKAASDKGNQKCATCHSLAANKSEADQPVYYDLQGNPQSPPFCVECHTDPNGQLHWGSKPWLTNPDGTPGEHPRNIFTRLCIDCHSADLRGKFIRGANVIRGCYDCHAGPFGDFAGHLTGPLARHKSYLQQSAAALALTLAQMSERLCYQCHRLAENRPVQDINNITGQGADRAMIVPACASCHTTYPHIEWIKEHQKEVGANGFNLCRPCHGQNFEGDELTPGCAACHAQGKNFGAIPHNDPNWPTPAGHGAEVKKNGTGRCEICHVINDPKTTETKWPDGTVLPTCYKCHAGPSGKPASHTNQVWPRYSPNDPATHAGLLLTKYYDPIVWVLDLGQKGGNCQSCHFDNGKNWETCHACHGDFFPHPDASVWLDPGSGKFHRESYKLGDCATHCHGPDLKGGDTQIACDLCHAMPK